VILYHLNKKIPLKPQDIVKMLKNRLRRAEILLDWEWKKNKKSLNYEQQTLQEIIHMMLAPYQKEIQNGHTLPLALIDSGNIKPGPVNLMALTHYKKNQTGDILKVLKGIKMNTLFHEYNPKQKVLSAVLIQALHDEGFVFLNQNNPAQMLEVKKVPQLQAWLQSMADHMHPDALYEDQLKQRRWRAFLNGKRKKDHRLITNAKVVSPILGMSHFSEVMSYLIKILHQRFPNLEVELLDLDDLDSNAKESMRADRDGRSDLPDRIYHQYIRENKFYNLLPLYDYEGRVLVYFQIQREKLKKLGFRRLKPLIKTIWNFDALVNKYFEKYVIDPMTKLQTTANLEKELEELIKNKTEFGLGFMDFNAFGAFDTTFGSQVGDQVLRSVIKLLKTQLNPKDNLYRRGGEEFILRAPSYQRLFNLSKKIAVILEGLQDHDLFTFNLKWSELENNLRHHLQDKIESRELTSQRLNEMINAVKESFLAQIDDKQTFDPKAEYAVNVLKIKRFSKKKNQLFQSISASIGILDIWKSTKFSADHMVHKAYEYSDYAKSEVNKEGSSGEQSVIYGLDLHHAKGAQPLLKPIDWHLPTP
jgi:GGDEF domain-containing protein